MRKILLCENALPTPLFRRLVRAVHAVGTERLKQNGSYTTTFWFPLGAKPANGPEEAIVKLCPLVRPGSKCVRMEWWLGRLALGAALSFHFHRSLHLQKQTRDTGRR